MSAEIEIRQARADEFAVAVDWAAAEGWNPGVDDLGAFYAADPGGFWMAFDGAEPVASISVVRYGPAFSFLGFYITREDRRGEGIGMRLWRAGLEYLGARTVGLDGVVAQQENYRRSGFELAGRNIRYSGRRPPSAQPRPGVAPIDAKTIELIAAYDATIFPGERADFVRGWAAPEDGAARLGLALLQDGRVAGYGVLRDCRDGFKIGPLFADDDAAAEALFESLIASASAEAEIVLDAPESNRFALRLAERAGLAPSFETARMYRGPAPAIPQERVYGVTSFELG